MRIAAGAALFAGPGGSVIWDGIRIISGILLVVGLWTPIAGTLVVIGVSSIKLETRGRTYYWESWRLLWLFSVPASGRSTPGFLAGRGSTYRNDRRRCAGCPKFESEILSLP